MSREPMRTKPRVVPTKRPDTQPGREPLWEPARTCPAQVQRVFSP
jgi:hypothetical protein